MTGQRYTDPSDNPMHAQRVERARRGQRESERFMEAITRLDGYHTMVDSTAASVTDSLVELSTLAVQMSNDSVDGAQRAIAAEHVGQLMDHMHSMANASYNGRYLFSGRLEDTPPYSDTYDYQGDDQVREVPVSHGVSVNADVLGTTIFGDAAAGELTVFDAAAALKTALEANDGDAIANALEGLKLTQQRVVAGRSRAGMVLGDLQKLQTHHEDLQFAYRVEENDLVSTDIAQAASELAFAEQVYQASLSTSSRITELLSRELRL